ncbi:glycerophosphodiester phosphodiesterase [Chitinibacteraceae bacterium HSL-7]
MLLISHRGLPRRAPENTLAAFADALSAGFHGIETDVRLCADGHAVLFHDRSIQGIAISQLTRAELSQRAGFLVPSVTEALDAFPDAFWNLELKSPSAAPALIRELELRRTLPRVLVTSLHHETMVELGNLPLELDLGLLVTHRPAALNALLYAALPLPRLRTLVWEYEMLDSHLTQQAGALGFRNWAYNAHSEAEHALCGDLGLNALITDHPECVGLTPTPALQ